MKLRGRPSRIGRESGRKYEESQFDQLPFDDPRRNLRAITRYDNRATNHRASPDPFFPRAKLFRGRNI